MVRSSNSSSGNKGDGRAVSSVMQIDWTSMWFVALALD